MDYLDSVNKKKLEADAKAQADFLHKQQMANTRNSANQIVDAIKTDSVKTKNVNVTNDIATKGDINNVINQLKENQLATLLGNQQPSIMLASGVKTEDIITPLNEKLSAALDVITKSNSNEKLAKQLDASFKSFTNELTSFMAAHQDMMTAIPQEIQDAVSGLDVKPVVNVPKAEVKVSQNNIDITPVIDKLDLLEKAIGKIKLPQVDNTDLLLTVDSVRSAIENQKFPVPNYVLPFKDSTGKAVQVQVDANGNLHVDITIPSGIATSANQTSGAQKTQISDSSGNAVVVKTLATQVTTSDTALVTNSVIHGLTTGGGGGYVDVKVNPSGALNVDSSGSTVTANIGTTNGLALDATLTGGTQQTKITDGTNTSNVIAGGTGNAIQTAVTSGPATAFSITSATQSSVIDMANYSYVSIQITSQGTSSTVTPQWSNDNSTWVGAIMYASNSNAVLTNTASTGIFYAGKAGRYFRLNVTGISAGTTAGTMIPFTGAMTVGTIPTFTITPSVTNLTGSITSAASVVTSTSTSTYSNLIPVTVHGTYAGVSFNITTSDDNGTTYYNTPVYDQTSGNWLAPGATITPGTNASKVYWVVQTPNNSGCLIKVTATAWTSGTASVRIGLTTTPNITGSTMSNIWDSAGNNRGANVNASNQLSVSVDNTPSVNAGPSTTTTVPTNALPAGYQARTSDISATTNAYNTIAVTDKVGKQIQLPYAIPENFVKAAANTTGTGSTALLAAAGAGVKNYVTSISVMNTGSTTTVINILDGASTIYTVGAPAGGGATLTLPVPLASTANTAINFNAVNASTTIYVSVAGYTGA